jgi:hypothetical protein
MAHCSVPFVAKSRGPLRKARLRIVEVSTVEEPQEPPVRFYPADEAMERARPFPSSEDLRIEGLTDEERSTFQEALAEL